MESEASGLGSSKCFFVRNELYALIRNSGYTHRTEKNELLRKHIQDVTNCPENKVPELNHTLSQFMSELHRRWTKARYTDSKFLRQNKGWLETCIAFKSYVNTIQYKTCKRGRPRLQFEEATERSKRQKTKYLRMTTSTAELTYATQMSLREAGKIDASVLIQEIASATPEKCREYRTILNKKSSPVRTKMSSEDALSLIINAKLSRYQYNLIREKQPELFPSYKKIQEAKIKCYPLRQFISVNETYAEVNLQAILDHTATRLLIIQEPVLESCNDKNDFYLLSKWGFDGSSGLPCYKQKFRENGNSDDSIFLSSFVPLQLLSGPDPKASLVLWKNRRPSSSSFCRPIRLQFIRETSEISLKEKQHIDNQIKSLTFTNVVVNERNIKIHHILIFSMIDGKICNALTDTKSTQTCYMCGATSKQFNNIDAVCLRPIKEDTVSFGLSILHAWIRLFECMLHVGYKLPIQKWQARGEADKQEVTENKKKIQILFRQEMGLLVDKPKPGFGSTNDGNTARRFFENATKSAQITGVDEKLIKDLHIILIALSSGHEIHPEKFKLFCLRVAKDFVEKYPWYMMPPTMHKILIHGPEVIKSSLLPIGQLSEEAQESRNKDLKLFRRDFSRKCQRIKTLEDIFHRLLVSSDPLISHLRKPAQRKIKTIPSQVLDLLLPAVVFLQDNQNSDDGSDNDTNEELMETSD